MVMESSIEYLNLNQWFPACVVSPHMGEMFVARSAKFLSVSSEVLHRCGSSDGLLLIMHSKIT